MNFIFHTGSMSSAKTLHLLAKRFELINRNAQLRLAVPQTDTRYGVGVVKSKAGLWANADFVLGPEDEPELFWVPDRAYPDQALYLLLDEAQFLSPYNVAELRRFADEWDVEVHAYGIRTDYSSRLFPGSKRLLELCDDVVFHHSQCSHCRKTSTFNHRLVTVDEGQQQAGQNLTKSNHLTRPEQQQILLGGDDLYKAVCSQCYAAERDIEP